MEKLLVIIVKISDCISFSLKTSKRNKHYKYTLLVFSLCTFLFMFGLTFRDNFVSYINNTITQNIGFRSLLVSPNLESEDYGLSKIKNMQSLDRCCIRFLDFKRQICCSTISMMLWLCFL